MSVVKFYRGQTMPLELHKVRIVQKLSLVPVERRQAAIAEAGNNTFLLKNHDVFLDMLTDSGVNAMSDRQLAQTIAEEIPTSIAPAIHKASELPAMNRPTATACIKRAAMNSGRRWVQ